LPPIGNIIIRKGDDKNYLKGKRHLIIEGGRLDLLSQHAPSESPKNGGGKDFLRKRKRMFPPIIGGRGKGGKNGTVGENVGHEGMSAIER